MSTTLYRKYRPRIFADVIGQKHIVQTLTNALKYGRVGQAYLLTGPRGTGKTTLARLFAKAINCADREKNSAEPCNHCEHCLRTDEGRSLDIIEIDAASHTGVDNIRELRETIKLPPTLGSHKVYIIDEVHMLSIGAFNALLKTLEEPPVHVVFILATTALHKVPDTIISRCQRFDLSRFPVKLIVEKLNTIATTEKINIDKEALQMIALTAEGGMRDAESLLTQIASLETSHITADTIIEILGTTKQENITTLLHSIAKNELHPSLAFVRKLSDDGVDPAIFCGALLHYLRDLLLISADPQNGGDMLENLTGEQKTTLVEFARIFTPADIVAMLEYFQVAHIGSKSSVIPELPLEIAIVKILSTNSHAENNNTDVTGTSPSDQKHSNQIQTQSTLSTTITTPTIQSSPQKKSIEMKETDFSGNYQKSQSQPIVKGKQKPKKQTTDTTTVSTPPDITQASGINIGTVREKWSAILNTAKTLNASLTLALSTARPIATTGTTITIAVKYPFHQERLNERANQLTLTNAFDTILGSKTKLAIVLEETETSRQTNTEPQKNFLVTQALDLLGGKLVKELEA